MSDADHRRRVEQRRIMSQAEKNNRNYKNKNPQFVFPVEPSQETNPDQEQDSFITPPNKSPEGHHNNQGCNHSGHKGRGRGRGRGKGRGPSNPKSFSATFTAAIRIIQPISAQRKKERLSGWKKRKKPNWSATPHGQDLRCRRSRRHPHYTIQHSNPCPPSPTTHTQTTGLLCHQLTPNRSHYPRLRASSRLRKSYLRLLQAHPQSKSHKAPKPRRHLRCHPSA